MIYLVEVWWVKRVACIILRLRGEDPWEPSFSSMEALILKRAVKARAYAEDEHANSAG